LFFSVFAAFFLCVMVLLLSLLFLIQFINGGLGSYRGTVATSRTAIGNLCPNGCSGRGVCLNNATSICKCFPGFTTPDCSQRLCPAARAWWKILFNLVVILLIEFSNAQG
jgi:hypothetical protein